MQIYAVFGSDFDANAQAEGKYWVVIAVRFRSGSISEVITLNAPCSGDELKAEPICCLISGVFSSQFGQQRNCVRRTRNEMDHSKHSGNGTLSTH